jgi:hypothetical protein
VAGYRTRTPQDLAWDNTRRHADMDIRDLVADARDRVMTELDSRFNANIQAGIIQPLRVSRAELCRMVIEALGQHKIDAGE